MMKTQDRGFAYGVKHFYCTHSGPLSEVIAADLQISLTSAEDLISLGSVYVENQRCSQVSLLISEKTYLRVHTKPRRFPLTLFQESFCLIGENEDFVVLHKPSGLPVHGTVDNLQENFQALAEEKLQQKLLVTHRLDVPTEGLIVFAKNLEFQSAFNQLLKQKAVRKIYSAVLVGAEPPVGLWVHYMKPSPRAPKEVSGFAVSADWQKCELNLNSRTEINSHSYLVEIELLTGRTHQIRAQSSALGCPVQYDVQYGAAAHPNRSDLISLCSQELEFKWKDQSYHFKIEKHWSSDKPDYLLA